VSVALGFGLALVVILGAAVLFTNAVEILGGRLELGQGAVGSVLAALGMALPETMIPIVAILAAVFSGEGGEAAGEIGIGAILGAPFLLAALAMFVTGAAAVVYRGRREQGMEISCLAASVGDEFPWCKTPGKVVIVDQKTIARDVSFPDLRRRGRSRRDRGVATVREDRARRRPHRCLRILRPLRPPLRRRPGGGPAEAHAVALPVPDADLGRRRPDAPRPWAHRGRRGRLRGGGGAHGGYDRPAGWDRRPHTRPLATELPEKINSVLWVREGKDTLALGNITGAMVFQSIVPVTFGILFASWELAPLNLFSATLALVCWLPTLPRGADGWSHRMSLIVVAYVKVVSLSGSCRFRDSGDGSAGATPAPGLAAGWESRGSVASGPDASPVRQARA
jgi:cation:H+ antiporter